MNRFKEAPRSDLEATPHKSVEEFIASAPIKTVTKPMRPWEIHDPNARPRKEYVQLRLNRYQLELLKAVAKHNSRSSHSEVMHTLLRHLEESKKELL